MSSEPKNCHNEGQEDASEGVHEPPHECVKELLFTWSDREIKEHAEENRSYNEGWHHTKDQIDD